VFLRKNEPIVKTDHNGRAWRRAKLTAAQHRRPVQRKSVSLYLGIESRSHLIRHSNDAVEVVGAWRNTNVEQPWRAVKRRQDGPSGVTLAPFAAIDPTKRQSFFPALGMVKSLWLGKGQALRSNAGLLRSGSSRL